MLDLIGQIVGPSTRTSPIDPVQKGDIAIRLRIRRWRKPIWGSRRKMGLAEGPRRRVRVVERSIVISPRRDVRFACGPPVLALVAAAACAQTTRRGRPPAIRSRINSCSTKAPPSLDTEKVADGARIFQAGRRDLYGAARSVPTRSSGIGDTYLGEGTSEALVLAINEYREFLSFYPTNKRADYARSNFGFCHFKQMRAPQRDQTETREAIKEFEAFVDRYPNEQPPPRREGAAARGKGSPRRSRLRRRILLLPQPLVSRCRLTACSRWSNRTRGHSHRDAAYFYLGESLIKLKREAEALPYFERLVQEFEQSEYLPDAQRRIAELKAAATKTDPPAE